MTRSRTLAGWYKLRWQVLQRDSYTCQYCGQSAPSVQLEVDHKVAVADGGTDDLSNLITACWACNRGKAGLRQSIVLHSLAVSDVLNGSALRRYRQDAVLAMLVEKPGMTTTEVGESCGITTQNAAMALGRLRKAMKVAKTGREWFILTP